MRKLLIHAATAAALGLAAMTTPARANVTFDFIPPFAGFFPGLDSITVTDGAYDSGSLKFSAVCGGGVCTASVGWVSGFAWPYADSYATVDLLFNGDSMTGDIHILQGTADQEYFYQNLGNGWNATWHDGNEVFTGTGDYQRVPEPATAALLGVGLLGLLAARQMRHKKRRRDCSRRRALLPPAQSPMR